MTALFKSARKLTCAGYPLVRTKGPSQMNPASRLQIRFVQIARDNRAVRNIYGVDIRPDQLDRTILL